MKLVVYGTLRKDEALDDYLWNICSKLSKRAPSIEVISLRGYALYNLGDFPGLKKGSKKDGCIAEIWEIKLSKKNQRQALKVLDFIEGVEHGLYERKMINTPKGKAWVYLYCGSIESAKKIKDWKEDKHNYSIKKGVLIR